VWPLNVGQVYSTVQRLERDGLVVADAESAGEGGETGPQKGYRITPAGTAELAAWLRTPPEDDAPPRDELVIKVLVALRLPGVDVPAILQAHRRATIERMQRYTRLKEQAADDMALLLVADAQLFRLESVVRWLDAAQTRLRMRPEPAVPAVEQPASEPAPGRTGALR
jgi:DNA-binding PadR family transcriptional regulator